MRGSNLLVTVQIRGMIKEEEKRNRSPPVLIFRGGKKTRESICERKARRERKNREAQQNQGELESRGGGFHTKRLSFTYERKKKRAKEKLLLASWTQCQTQSASGLAARLVSQAPAHNGGDPGPPHLSLPICVLQDGTESEGAAWRDDNALEEILKFLLYKKRNSTWRELD